MKNLFLIALAIFFVSLIPAMSTAGTVEITFEAVGTDIDEHSLYLLPADGYDNDHTVVTGVITYDPSMLTNQIMTIHITLSAPALDGVSSPYEWGSYNEDRLVAYDLMNNINAYSFIYDEQWLGTLHIMETVFMESGYWLDHYDKLFIETDELLSPTIPPGGASGLPLDFSGFNYDPEWDGYIEFYRFDAFLNGYKSVRLEFNITSIHAQSITIDPVANAGSDQIVFDNAALDGSQSYDLDGIVESYQWDLQHRENPIYNQTTEGVNPEVSNLESGFYDITLTVSDDDGLTASDTVVIVAAGACFADNDDDGYSIEMGDCNDNDANIHPGAIETCDEIDNNCDDQADEGFDADGDSYTTCGGDCNDNNPLINPVADELPGNGTDENCDGSLGNCDPNASWNNHGMYVRCVTHEVEWLVSEGIINQEQGDILINSAAMSDIGKKK